MHTAPVSRKEEIWLACKPKACCYVTTVIPTGRDVWRIARALESPPWTFVRYFESPVPRRDAFRLDNSGREFRLALAKQPSRRRKSAPPCLFLLKTNSGHHRCALGALRPRSCQAFPAELAHEVVCLNPAGCTCREWSLADIDIAEERALLALRRQENEEYVSAVVAPWNARVAATADAHFAFTEYCEFVLQVYDEISASQTRGDR